MRTINLENVRFDLKLIREAMKPEKLKTEYFCILAKMQN